MTLHILRLAFGIRSLAHLRRILEKRTEPGPDGAPTVAIVTRYKPRRAREILDGGSLYWIVKGQIRARQRFIAIEDIEPETTGKGPSGKRRCAFRLDPELVLTVPVPRRVQQGWRYLEAEDAPDDFEDIEYGEQAPSPELAAGLRELGLIYD